MTFHILTIFPDFFRGPLDYGIVERARRAGKLGIPAIALFPLVPAERKNEHATEALNPDNLVCRAVRALKKSVPEIGVICDVALEIGRAHV